MSLTKQCHLYSIDTSSFYDEEERKIHNRLVRLYILRNSQKIEKENKRGKKKIIYKWKQESAIWRKSYVNKLIKKYKDELTAILDSKLNIDYPRELNTEDLKDKNIISLFESSLTRALDISTNSLTQDIFVVNVYFFQIFKNLINNGFTLNGEKYIFLSASAGQIRTKKAVFIKESRFEEVRSRLMCGLTVEDINKQGGINTNKYNAYFSLNNSATDVWEDFDIDKCIVVDDFETNVLDVVDFVNDIDYSVTRKKMEVLVPHMDGCGIMDGPKTRMLRMPWVKGLLVNFPFRQFIQEYCPNGECVVTDIYGKKYSIIQDDIRYILTKSQFKLYKYYSSWDEYKYNFKKYQCEVCYCNIEENDIPDARINYQMLQTLSDMTDDEIQVLIKDTVNEINSIGQDYRTSMRLLGATPSNLNPSWIQQALMIYPELFRDPYFRDIFKQTKKSLVKQAKAGRLRMNGGYRFVSPDLFAFCEWLFLGKMNPRGILENGEVYCRGYNDKDELACLRSPHLYREWAIRENRRNEELDRWFGGTDCVYTSCHDLISKLLQFD